MFSSCLYSRMSPRTCWFLKQQVMGPTCYAGGGRQCELMIEAFLEIIKNNLKFDLTTTFLSTRRNSWPSVAYETTLRHTTSGIFEPFDDDEDDYAANVDNVEFVPSKSPCCNGRTFDFNVRTNDFRTNVVRPFWSSPTRQSFRQNAIDVCEDSGQGRCYKNSFCRNYKITNSRSLFSLFLSLLTKINSK